MMTGTFLHTVCHYFLWTDMILTLSASTCMWWNDVVGFQWLSWYPRSVLGFWCGAGLSFVLRFLDWDPLTLCNPSFAFCSHSSVCRAAIKCYSHETCSGKLMYKHFFFFFWQMGALRLEFRRKKKLKSKSMSALPCLKINSSCRGGEGVVSLEYKADEHLKTFHLA